MPLERNANDLAFHIIEIYGVGRQRKPELPVYRQRVFYGSWHVVECQSIAVGKDHHPLDQILQLTHVAHPRVIEKDLKYLAGYFGRLNTVF